jgi:hypothetical protein
VPLQTRKRKSNLSIDFTLFIITETHKENVIDCVSGNAHDGTAWFKRNKTS